MGLRIALVAPLVSAIREPMIGGVAVFLTDLAEGLQASGHSVDLFAASGSRVDGLNIVDTGVDPSVLSGAAFRPLGGDRPEQAVTVEAFRAAYEKVAEGEYDLVHNHSFDASAISLAGLPRLPVLHTLHLPPDAAVAAALQAAGEGRRPPHVAVVSENQRSRWATKARVDVVLRPGVPTGRIEWSGIAPGGLLFAARLSPEKGAIEAIRIAEISGRDLIIAGSPYDLEYAGRVERASAGKNVSLTGPLGRSQLWKLMRDATALLSPIAWEEPFGLAMAEAQAAGCPVVAFKRGATQELIVDGRTGILVEPGDVAGAARAVSTAAALDRSACRLHAERALDISRCIEAHLAFYEKMVSRA